MDIKNEAKHTPTPWYASDILDNDCFGIVTADNEIIIGTSGNIRREADVRFIVRAVNSHEELLATLKQEHSKVIHTKEFPPTCGTCQTIAKAKGK